MSKVIMWVQAVFISLSVAACSSSTPTSDEVKKLVDEQFSKPACATSVIFRRFPATLAKGSLGPGPAAGNKGTFDAFVSVGLLQETVPSTYDLTEKGRADYRKDRQGFCFASGHKTVNVKDVSSIPASRLGNAVEAGWLATVEIAPKDLKPWISDLPQAVSSSVRKKIEKSIAPRTVRVKIFKLRGDEKLTVKAGPTSRDVYFNASFL
jgi:hypothetical protein